MATQPSPAVEVPPVHVLLGEVVTSLVFVARTYLEPPPGEAAPAADLESAEIVLDVAGRAFDRIQARLPQDERSGLARLLTDLRMTYVKKRGL